MNIPTGGGRSLQIDGLFLFRALLSIFGLALAVFIPIIGFLFVETLNSIKSSAAGVDAKMDTVIEQVGEIATQSAVNARWNQFQDNRLGQHDELLRFRTDARPLSPGFPREVPQ